MKKVGIIYKQEDRVIAGTAEQITKELKSQGYKVGLKGAQFLITLGGDGTILRAARMLAGKNVPILGVHLGGLGFLSEIDLVGLGEALDQIKKGDYELDERTMIEATAGGKKLIALNDIVISHSGIARVIRVEIEGLAEYLSDGVIFSTATGSTAYNLSAGGPILTPKSSSMIISAICPHSLATRPLVVECSVNATLNQGQGALLTADGQKFVALKEGSKIKIQKSKLKTRFIRLKGYDFFARVRASFSFGSRV
ncbi:MAG: NAD(+)/NADH kinase [bacterium]